MGESKKKYWKLYQFRTRQKIKFLVLVHAMLSAESTTFSSVVTTSLDQDAKEYFAYWNCTLEMLTLQVDNLDMNILVFVLFLSATSGVRTNAHFQGVVSDDFALLPTQESITFTTQKNFRSSNSFQCYFQCSKDTDCVAVQMVGVMCSLFVLNINEYPRISTNRTEADRKIWTKVSTNEYFLAPPILVILLLKLFLSFSFSK